MQQKWRNGANALANVRFMCNEIVFIAALTVYLQFC